MLVCKLTISAMLISCTDFSNASSMGGSSNSNCVLLLVTVLSQTRENSTLNIKHLIIIKKSIKKVTVVKCSIQLLGSEPIVKNQAVSPVSIQTQSLALRKRKPQETQALALASSQSWLPLLRPSIPIGWRLLATNASASQ